MVDDIQPVELETTRWRSLASDPFASSMVDIATRVINSPDVDGKVKGAAALYLFVQTAERWAANGQSPKDEDWARCSKLLSREDLRTEFGTMYKSFKTPFDKCELHRVGTTSYILEVKRPRIDVRRAIKILKPEYVGIPTIETATAEYGSGQHSRETKYLATIYTATKTDIEMTFVPGYTLADELGRLRGQKEPTEITTWVCDIVGRITTVLERLQQYDTGHYDLAPANIIRDSRDGEDAIVLVDIGVNHIVRHHGALSGPDAASRYIAPEVRRTGDASDVADAYSLGVIIVDALACVRPETAGWEEKLELVRDIRPEMALLLEACLDDNPQTRAFEYRVERLNYAALRTKLLTEVRAFEKEYVSEASAPESVLRFLLSFVMPKSWLAAIRELLVGLGWGIGRSGQRYEGWAQVAAAVSYLTVFGAVGWAVSTLRRGAGRSVADTLTTLAAVSFVFLASGYYQLVLQRLRLLPAFRKTAVAALVTSIVPVGLLVLASRGGSPGAWAILAGFGAIYVSLVNASIVRACSRARKLIDESELRVPRPPDYGWGRRRFLRRFANWAVAMFVYGLVLIILGKLLEKHALKDEVAYLALCAIINLYLLTVNCASLGPAVQGSLMWYLDHAKRATTITKARQAKKAAPMMAPLAG